MRKVSTFRIRDGKVVEVFSKEWKHAFDELLSLKAELKARYKNDEQGYVEWKKNAVLLLPEGVFVWRRQFEANFAEDLSRVILIYEEYGDRELIYDPIFPGGLDAQQVLAGFVSSEVEAAARDQVVEAAISGPNPEIDSAPPQAAFQAYSFRTRTHKTPTRNYPLDHVIRKARSNAEEPDNYHSVWAELLLLAALERPPTPLMGQVEGEGIKYDSGNKVKFLTKDALRKRMNPSAR